METVSAQIIGIILLGLLWGCCVATYRWRTQSFLEVPLISLLMSCIYLVLDIFLLEGWRLAAVDADGFVTEVTTVFLGSFCVIFALMTVLWLSAKILGKHGK